MTPGEEPYAVPQNYTSVEIRLSNLYTHGQVRYAIDGGEWTTASGVPALRINELQSGRHTLLIRNLDPVNPPQEPLELVFDVAYPWYLQGRFIAGMLLAAPAAGAGRAVPVQTGRGAAAPGRCCGNRSGCWNARKKNTTSSCCGSNCTNASANSST